MFKQFELIYVVGEERDLVGVRAIHRRETVYLYQLNTSLADARHGCWQLKGYRRYAHLAYQPST